MKNIKNYFKLDKIEVKLKYGVYSSDSFNNFYKKIGINKKRADRIDVSIIFNKIVLGNLSGENFKINISNKEVLNVMAQLISYEYAKYKSLREECYSSKYDKLTGLLNHNSYARKISKLNIESLSSLGVLYVDVNNFKNINFISGRKYGDEILKKIADSFSNYFPVSLKFRLYGDIFFVLCEDLTYKKFENSVRQWEKFIDENFIISISIGKAWSDVDIDFNKLCKTAEEFLKYSKEEYYDKKEIEELQKMKRKLKLIKI